MTLSRGDKMNKSMQAFINYLIDQSTPDKPIWNKEVILYNKEAKWNYIDGVMLIALMELYHLTHDSKYFNFVKAYVDHYINEDGSLKGYDISHYSTDDICASRVLFDLYQETQDPVYKRGLDTSYRHVLRQPRTKEGLFWHKLIYPHQVWLDGLYMAQPFYAQYDISFLNALHLDDIENHYKQVRKNLFNTHTHTYVHAYDSSKTAFWADKETGKSKHTWLRALGWFSASMVDVYDVIQHENHSLKDTLKTLYSEFIDGLLPYLDNEHYLFHQVIDIVHDDNYLETSGSALIAYSLLKASRLGMISHEKGNIGYKIYQSIIDNRFVYEDDRFKVTSICLVAGLGPDDNIKRDGSFEYYMSEPVVEDDAKGVAPLLLAYVEILKREV